MSEPTSNSITPPWSESDRPVPRTLVQPLQRFLHTEASGGIVLLAATVAALAWANSAWATSYTSLWSTPLEMRVGGFELTGDLRHWVNDLAMTLFFFVAGLEIKRELVHGEMRAPRLAMLPIACAFGGMAVPALIFTAAAGAGPGRAGWGIPMATDIAFALGVLALCGRRVPASLKVFLLTLAIVDDIGAIVVIAVFYSVELSFGWLVIAAAALGATALLQRLHVRSYVPYVVLAVITWVAAYESGIHATIAGVALGLLAPARPFHRPADAQRLASTELDSAHLRDEVAGEDDETTLLEVSGIVREAVSPLARLERALHPWSAFVVLPLFALANAGLSLSSDALGQAAGSRTTLAVVLGLVIGKPVGIALAALLVVKRLGGALPDGAGWLELIGVGVLAGIGFTVSIFIAGIAFGPTLAGEAKIGVLAASVLAGTIGAGLLLVRGAANPLVRRRS